MIFFFLQGIIVPNFDDIHYTFLREELRIKKHTYDFLNACTYFALFIFMSIFNSYFSKTDSWKLVLNSLVLFTIMTLLMLSNATRLNLDLGISDEALNVFVFILST